MSRRIQKLLDAWEERFLDEAAADGFAWLLERNQVAETDEEARRAAGAKLARRHVSVVTMVADFAGLDSGGSRETVAQIERFLARQDYGGYGETSGAAFTVRLIGPRLQIDVHVDRLEELDLEDLEDAVPYYEVRVRSHVAEMDDELAATLVGQIREDLAWSGDEIELSWYEHDGELVVTIEPTE